MIDTLHKIRQNKIKLQTLTSLVSQIKTLNAKYSNAVYSKTEEKQFQSEKQQIESKFKSIVEEVKEFLQNTENDDNSVVNDQLRTLTVNLSAAVNEFRKIEIEQKQREKEILREKCLIAKPNATEEEINKMLTFDNPHSSFLNSQKQESVSEVQRRSDNLKKIVILIDELHSMVQEIDSLVQEQSEFVDQIEIDVVTSKSHTERINTSLKNIIIKKRRWKWIKRIGIALVTIFLILALAYVFNSFIAPFIKK